jgi:UDP-N-acetylmuramate dehydrogenase
VLVPDAGIEGLTLKIELRGIKHHDDEGGDIVVSVAAGEPWDVFVEETVRSEWWGIENLSGIPGTVGAAPIQNIGAYGAEVAEVIERVHGIDMRDGSEHTWSREECCFAYRDSFFKSDEGKHFIITRVDVRLSKQPGPRLEYRDVAAYFADHKATPTIGEVRGAILAIRSRKFPDLATYGTAGSFFKNPIIDREAHERLLKIFPAMPSYPAEGGKVKIPAGWLIEHVAGFRGVRRGDVGSFENQSLVIVNYGSATAREVRDFTEDIRMKVREETGIELAQEVQLFP